MNTKLESAKNKINYFIFTIFLLLINFYITSLGLMDDFFYTRLNFFENYKQYFDFLSRDLISGGIRPFLPLQITLNNLGYFLFSYKGYFILNLLILFLILEFFYFVFNEIFKLNKYLYYVLFFSWPYSYDLIIHPSLQEKFIILFVTAFIYAVINKSKNNIIVTLLSLSIPLVKIQGLVFFPLIWSVANSKLNKNNNKQLITSAFILSSFLVIGIFFLRPESYFNQGIQVDRLLIQVLSSPVNLINVGLLTLVFALGNISKIENLNILNGLIYSNALLIFFMSAYKPIGNYLNSINIFFIIIYILIIYNFLNSYFVSARLSNIINISSFIFFLIIMQTFAIPRFERMNSIKDVIDFSLDNESQNIFYTCSEGITYLNEQQNKNEFIFVNDLESLKNKDFLFLSDPFACNNVEDDILKNCSLISNNTFKYKNSMEIKKYQC